MANGGGSGSSTKLTALFADENIVAGWIQHPVVAFTGVVVMTRYFDEAFVETKIVSDRVLPSLLVLAVKWELGHNPLVDAV